MQYTELMIPSTLDGTMQPSLFYKAGAAGKRPLLVGLHTWSHNRFNQIDNMLPLAKAHNFHLLLPEFRGGNLKSNPRCKEACGSEYARQDIKDAIDYLLDHEEIDVDNIFLLGSSGGGHMALLMAGFCPEYFKAVGAYVPITDLSKWIKQNQNYRENLIACCGDNEQELLKRSPISYVHNIAKANVKIFHGKFDPVVPVSQSLELFSAIMRSYPEARVFLDIFDGGHEMDMEQAGHWVMSQYKENRKIQVTG